MSQPEQLTVKAPTRRRRSSRAGIIRTFAREIVNLQPGMAVIDPWCGGNKHTGSGSSIVAAVSEAVDRQYESYMAADGHRYWVLVVAERLIRKTRRE